MHNTGRFLFLVFFLGLPFFASAGEKIEVTPAFQEVILEAGQSLPNEIIINNKTESDQQLFVRGVSFESLDTAGGVAFLGADINNEALPTADFITFDNASLTIPKGEAKTFSFRIEDTDNLAPGGHYAALVFQSLPTIDESTAEKIAVKQIFSSLIFLEKRGGERKELKLADIQWRKFFWTLPRSLELHFSNTGNTHVTPRGVVEIRDPFGRTVTHTAVNESSSILLPGQERILFSEFKYTAWLPGKYTLLVSYRHSDTEDTIEKKETFFLLPYQFVVGVGMAVILLLLCIQRRFVFKKRL
jgi:hypothetical protein